MNLSNESKRIRERIFNLFPVHHMGYLKLLGLMDIQADYKVPTAAVSTGFRSILKINPGFVEQHCQSDEAFSMLVLHEMMHLLLGHTRLFPRTTPVLNFAFDAVINAHLCQLFPQPEYTALFRNLYSDTRLPEALLRPPENWNTASRLWKLPGEAGELHRTLYGNLEIGNSEVVEMMERFFLETQIGFDIGKLLGNHGQDGTPSDAELDPELLKNLRDLIARWPRNAILGGRDEGGDLLRQNIAPQAPRRAIVQTIRRALLSLLNPDEAFSRFRHVRQTPQPGLLPWRTPSDRRGIVLESITGQPRFFWEGEIGHRALSAISPPCVYIDVSGSMSGIIDLIYGALLPLKSLIDPRPVLFSTEAKRIPFRQLREGVVHSTFGTSIACVTQDMVEHRAKRALIITDGYCGDIPKDHLRALRHGRFATVLTHGGDAGFAKPLRGTTCFLPEIKNP